MDQPRRGSAWTVLCILAFFVVLGIAAPRMWESEPQHSTCTDLAGTAPIPPPKCALSETAHPVFPDETADEKAPSLLSRAGKRRMKRSRA